MSRIADIETTGTDNTFDEKDLEVVMKELVVLRILGRVKNIDVNGSAEFTDPREG